MPSARFEERAARLDPVDETGAQERGETHDAPTPTRGGGAGFAGCCALQALVIGALATGTTLFVRQLIADYRITEVARGAEVLARILPTARVPDGYSLTKATDGSLFGVWAVCLERDEGRRGVTFLVARCPAGATPAQIREQFERLDSMVRYRLGSAGTPTTVSFTVRGKQVAGEETLGTDFAGTPVRTLEVGIPTADPQEQVRLVVCGDHEGFDQAAVDAFLGSIDGGPGAAPPVPPVPKATPPATPPVPGFALPPPTPSDAGGGEDEEGDDLPPDDGD